MRISIIIPVYNTPKEYLDRVFYCLCSQTVSDHECIIVDDGSKKEIADYLDAYDFGQIPVRIIHKENGGVSRARNLGISQANGDFIAFVDADDSFSADFVKSGKAYLEKYDVDVICGTIGYDTKGFREKQSENQPVIFEGADLIEAKKALLNVRPRNTDFRILGSPCGKLYRKNVLSGINFPEGVTHYEDQIFNRLVFEKARSVLIVPDLWYIYHQNVFSAMHQSIYKGFCEKQMRYWDLCMQLDQKENTEIRNGLRRNYLHDYGSLIKENCLNSYKKTHELKAALQLLASHPIMKDAVDGLSVFDKYITSKQRVHLLMLKQKMYYLFALEQHLING